MANLKSVQGKIKESKEEKQETKKELEKIEQQLEEANNNLEKIKTDLDSTNRALDKAKDELAKAEEAMENQNMTLSERIRVMYKNGNIGYLEVLLEAESFSDFISRIEMIKTIMEYDYELLNTLEEKKREVEDKKLKLSLRFNLAISR